MWALAEMGSKLDGTGLEKLQIVHTQVAEVTFRGSGAGRDAPPSAAPKGLGPPRWGLPPAFEVLPRERWPERF